MVASKTLSWLSVVIALIVGRNEIYSFFTSFSQGLNSILNSLPSVVIIGILVLFIIRLSKK